MLTFSRVYKTYTAKLLIHIYLVKLFGIIFHVISWSDGNKMSLCFAQIELYQMLLHPITSGRTMMCVRYSIYWLHISYICSLIVVLLWALFYPTFMSIHTCLRQHTELDSCIIVSTVLSNVYVHSYRSETAYSLIVVLLWAPFYPLSIHTGLRQHTELDSCIIVSSILSNVHSYRSETAYRAW